MTSFLLAAFVFSLSGLCAGAVLYFGRKAGQSETKLKSLVVLFLVGGGLMSLFAFITDNEQRRTTLFEVVLPGSSTASPGPAQERTFLVEHSGVAHELMVVPLPPPGDDAKTPVDLSVELRDIEGKIVLQERRGFATEQENSGARSLPRRVWESAFWPFTPETQGRWTLRVQVHTKGVAKVHVRVEDPQKTDGERAPGY